jgi:hypothetical protein
MYCMPAIHNLIKIYQVALEMKLATSEFLKQEIISAFKCCYS